MNSLDYNLPSGYNVGLEPGGPLRVLKDPNGEIVGRYTLYAKISTIEEDALSHFNQNKGRDIVNNDFLESKTKPLSSRLKRFRVIN